MRQMLLRLVILILLAGCGGGGNDESSQVYNFLKNNGYEHIKQQGNCVQYLLNKKVLTRNARYDRMGTDGGH
ncbi:hypothetical protein M3194_00105 [Paenibacillus glycanilyticus]|uniref:hypothetical protein n=1 Tax=Paenibacillus glycanilyticus TaxID=126569 RepID=UPI00203C0E6E|nr:hypothetical protein [Paenibacillus glycanilyticus]MCM3625761.1 hypothetical protein [Paenibacillus glycanilyticus]